MAPVRKSLAMQVDGSPMERDRPKRTWMEMVKIDLKKCNLSKDLVEDRSEWRNKINVVDPHIVAQGFDDDDLQWKLILS